MRCSAPGRRSTTSREPPLPTARELRDAARRPHLSRSPRAAAPVPWRDRATAGSRQRAAARADRLRARRRVEQRLDACRPRAGAAPPAATAAGPVPARTSAALGHAGPRLQQRLRGTRRHHAGQGPARDRERPLERAGREDDAPRLDQARRRRATETPSSRAESRLHTVAPLTISGAACPGLAGERFARPVVLAQDARLRDRRGGDGAVDLAAGAGFSSSSTWRSAARRAVGRRRPPMRRRRARRRR